MHATAACCYCCCCFVVGEMMINSILSQIMRGEIQARHSTKVGDGNLLGSSSENP
jgi:hypothetical protein